LTLRAEQIMAAAQTRVTGLATTGTSVDRGRADDLPVELLPAIRVAMGDDSPLDPYLPVLVDSELHLTVTAYAYDTASNIETKLNQIRAEATAALLADRTLGLSFVHAIFEMGASQPELAGDLSKPAGRMEMKFKVRYRRSANDPAA
jgi:hypothetical protein